MLCYKRHYEPAERTSKPERTKSDMENFDKILDDYARSHNDLVITQAEAADAINAYEGSKLREEYVDR